MARKHRKNFFPAFFINLVLWLLVLLIVLKTSPDQKMVFAIADLKVALQINLIGFLFLFFLALGLTLALLLGNTRRGFFLSSFFAGLLTLQLVKQAHWLNFLLLAAIVLTAEFYFSQIKRRKVK